MWELRLTRMGRGKHPQRRMVEGNGLELTLGSDLELSVLDSCAWCPRIGSSMCGACANSITWEHLEMQILGPTPGLLGLRFRELSFNNPPDD